MVKVYKNDEDDDEDEDDLWCSSLHLLAHKKILSEAGKTLSDISRADEKSQWVISFIEEHFSLLIIG